MLLQDKHACIYGIMWCGANVNYFLCKSNKNKVFDYFCNANH